MEKLGESSKRLVVVTGCDSGIGKSFVDALLERGHSVVISYLAENPFENMESVFARRMDMRISEEVDGFCDFVDRLCGAGYSVDCFVSNAGVALGGPVENVPIGIYREIFDINYFGALSIIKRMIPHLIESKGRIVVVGSMAGRIAMPFMSPYVSTKFALEGLCDSLRRELNPFGIRTILVEPGAVATPIWNNAKKQDISFVDEKYMKSLYSFQKNFIEGGNQGMSPAVAGEQLYTIITRRKPKARYIIAQNRLTTAMLLLLPSWLLDMAVIRMFSMYYGEKQSVTGKGKK